ncbi:MAG: hypothetical protein ACP5HM_07160 [Anaerolineae bacterium]
MFVIVLSIVNTVAIYSVLWELPSLRMRMYVWDIVGVASYALTFALIESLGLFMLVWALTYLLPRDLFSLDFVTMATLIVFLLIYGSMGLTISGMMLNLWLLGLVAMLGLTYFAIKYRRVREVWWEFLERLTVLAAFFLLLDVVSLLIVMVRNIP